MEDLLIHSLTMSHGRMQRTFHLPSHQKYIDEGSTVIHEVVHNFGQE